MECDNLIINKRIKRTATASSSSSRQVEDMADIKFYRKRIHDLSKQLLYGTAPDIFLKDVDDSFFDYAKSCVKYFKLLDKNDLNQEEYLYMLKPDTPQQEPTTTPDAPVDANRHIFTFKPPVQNSLEKLVKKLTPEPTPKAKLFIPLQKEFNLTDPALRNKGIRKKNNIPKSYEKDVEEAKKNEEGGSCPIDEKFFIDALQSESEK